MWATILSHTDTTIKISWRSILNFKKTIFNDVSTARLYLVLKLKTKLLHTLNLPILSNTWFNFVKVSTGLLFYQQDKGFTVLKFGITYKINTSKEKCCEIIF